MHWGKCEDTVCFLARRAVTGPQSVTGAPPRAVPVLLHDVPSPSFREMPRARFL